MTMRMFRGCLTAALALAALAPFSSAEAGPEASPFAGTYVAANWSFPVTILNGGQIKGSDSGAERDKVSIDGRVGADGSYSITLSVTSSRYDERRDRTLWHTSRYTLLGSMALDADGNIVDTPDNGGSFTWVRQ
ncbi:MAG TPA: hypothetical protein VFC86_09620 [Planctomycetota bacterium]|nr:hypothetical protein [Planctomycetota bacterium]